MVKVGGARTLQLLRSARQPKSVGRLPHPGDPSVVVRIAQAEPKRQKPDLGSNEEAGSDLDSHSARMSPISESTFLRLTRGRSRMR